ncbi:hypothetical protein COOONC_15471 [Cooperia oncophora]
MSKLSQLPHGPAPHRSAVSKIVRNNETYAAIERKEDTLAKSDAVSLMNLNKILEHLKPAATVGPTSASGDLAPRRELTREVAKPQLQNVVLVERKAEKTQSEEHFHEQVNRMREQP